MPASLAVLTLPGSPLGERVAAEAAGKGRVCHLLSLDAPLDGGRVTVRPGEVLWEGVDLLATGAVLVEVPVFPWPQGQRTDRAPAGPEEARAFFAHDREGRSLVVSAIGLAAELRPVWNRPAAAHMAASPAVALDRLGAAGIPVHPWRLSPAPDPRDAALVLDVAGRDRWHAPSRPAPGQPSLILDPLDGRLWSLLVAGGRIAGAVRFTSAGGWMEGAGPGAGVPAEAPGVAAILAADAAAALHLDLAAVTIADAERSPRIVLADAGPDLAAWDAASEGRLAALLAERLSDAAGEGPSRP